MTRQQEYEAKLLREARQIKLCRIIARSGSAV